MADQDLDLFKHNCYMYYRLGYFCKFQGKVKIWTKNYWISLGELGC